MVRRLHRWKGGTALLVVLALGGCGEHPGMEPGENTNGDGGVTGRDAGDVTMRDSGLPVAEPPLWAMFGADARRTGRSAALGPRRGAHRAVRLAAAGRVSVEAIGPAGHVYVWIGPEDDQGGEFGSIAALTPDGDLLWSRPAADATGLDGARPGAALTPAGSLLVKGLFPGPATTPDATEADLLVGLGLDGAPVWSYWGRVSAADLGQGGHGAVAYDAEGDFYAVLGSSGGEAAPTDRHLFAFASDGTLRWVWEREVGRAALPLALASDGSPRVIKSSGEEPPGADEGLYALEPETGAERWFKPMPQARLDHVTVGFGDRTFVTGYDVEVSGVGPLVLDIGAGGEEVFSVGWNPRKTDLITTPVALWLDGSWCLGLSHREGEDNPEEHGILACWDKGTFDSAIFETRGDPCGALAVDRENIVFLVTVGNGGPAQVHGVSVPHGALEGEALFSIDLPGETGECPGPGQASFVFAPALGDGRLYVGSTIGELHIFE